MVSDSDETSDMAPLDHALERERESLFGHAEQKRTSKFEDLRTSAAATRPKAAAVFSELKSIPFHSYDAQSAAWESIVSWRAVPISGGLAKSERTGEEILRIGTYNVLMDVFLPSVLKSLNSCRWNAILEDVKQSRAHVWIFSEAAPPFATYSLNDYFIQRTFLSSDSSITEYKTLSGPKGAAGQLMLVRKDVTLTRAHFAKAQSATGKKLVFIEAALRSGKTVTICGLHLTAGKNDRKGPQSAIKKRRKQLDFVVSRMEEVGSHCDVHVIAGDFNVVYQEDEHSISYALTGYIEADATILAPIYDSIQNGLAYFQTKQRSQERLDRIYLRSLSKGIHAAVYSHRVMGKSPVNVSGRNDAVMLLLPTGVRASDHFGIETTFLLSEKLEKTNKVQ
ncbi:hypothetical protein BWQ96_10301 [Gracilariopsis chorda]|uniref:Endonuclease/exonuclease/phosphatase domain-containing protein n=1 Tax=Gracilariopsis chorda TaxID=448386 RepID=A0A2V3ID23_9FLOR|nr:hypothetical protein BWQ96_10301 [Gracilariopsis chorda]|eukprot:PXF39986.1 hypothetical protein BWQ96_10301 [Gracilariopsis chorda]